MSQFQNCTLFNWTIDLGVKAEYYRKVSVDVGRYAQYEQAIFYQVWEPRKRRPRSYVEYGCPPLPPFLLVIDGQKDNLAFPASGIRLRGLSDRPEDAAIVVDYYARLADEIASQSHLLFDYRDWFAADAAR